VFGRQHDVGEEQRDEDSGGRAALVELTGAVCRDPPTAVARFSGTFASGTDRRPGPAAPSGS
jgi:hypothetical protein